MRLGHRFLPFVLAATAVVSLSPAVARSGDPEDARADASAITRPGRHEAGRWTYVLEITGEGSRSEGAQGVLMFDGVPLPPGRAGVYRTPWGDLAWVENEHAWGDHGWMPVDGIADRVVWPDPAGLVRLKVRMVGLSAGEPPSDGERPPAWATEAWRAAGRGPCRILGSWVVLGSGPVVLHDSKHFGRAVARLEPYDERTTVLRVALEGTAGEPVSLPRRHGEHALVRRTLGGRFGEIALELAFEVLVELGPPPGTPAPGGAAEPPAAPQAPAAPPAEPTAPPSSAGAEVESQVLETIHLVRCEADALVFGVMTSGYTSARSFRVVVSREKGARTVGIALVRVRRDEGKMVPQPIEVRYAWKDLGFERPVPFRVLNSLSALAD